MTMQSTQKSGDIGAGVVYELFNLYATWTACGRFGGLTFNGVKALLTELDLLEGIPGQYIDEYIRQHMLRADQDKDGQLCCQEFIIWFFTEIAALLPFKCNGDKRHGGAPLYNRFVFYTLLDSGDGVRRKASGLPLTHFAKMCKDVGVSEDAGVVRNGVRLASKQASSERTQGKLESGARLQFAQFVHALTYVAEHKRVALDSVLFRVVSRGSPPPVLQGGVGGNKTYRSQILKVVAPLFFESDMEAPLRKMAYNCKQCGQLHLLWQSTHPTVLESQMRKQGRAFPPYTPLVNTRNIRAVFHRYNLKLNKGLKPTNCPTPEEYQKGLKAWEDGSRSELDDDLWDHKKGPCCCMYRQLGLMEFQTWRRVCMDTRTVRAAIARSCSPFTPDRIEAAFLACCSIGGVYCGDNSGGVHDRPVSPTRTPVSPRMGGLSNPLGRGSGLLRPSTYGTPFDGASAVRASTARLPSAAALMKTSSAVAGARSRPVSASVSASMTGTPWSTALQISNHTAAMGSPAHQTHRPATPTLNFPQFLEAVRMVAEDIVGHPQTLVIVGATLRAILNDMVEVGCPLPAHKHASSSPCKCALRDLGEQSIWHAVRHADDGMYSGMYN